MLTELSTMGVLSFLSSTVEPSPPRPLLQQPRSSIGLRDQIVNGVRGQGEPFLLQSPMFSFLSNNSTTARGWDRRACLAQKTVSIEAVAAQMGF